MVEFKKPAQRITMIDLAPTMQDAVIARIQSALDNVGLAIQASGYAKQRRVLLGQARDFLQAALRTFDRDGK